MPIWSAPSISLSQTTSPSIVLSSRSARSLRPALTSAKRQWSIFDALMVPRTRIPAPPMDSSSKGRASRRQCGPMRSNDSAVMRTPSSPDRSKPEQRRETSTSIFDGSASPGKRA